VDRRRIRRTMQVTLHPYRIRARRASGVVENLEASVRSRDTDAVMGAEHDLTEASRFTSITP